MSIGDRQLFDAIKQQDNLKKFNHFLNILHDRRAYHNHLSIIQNYLRIEKEARDTYDTEKRKILEKQAEKFLNQMDHYYKQKAEASRQLDTTPLARIMEILESIIKNIHDDIAIILNDWHPEDRKDWEGNSWTDAVKNQAERYTEKANTMASDYIIQLIEQQEGIQLSDSEKATLQKSSETALHQLKEDLERMQQEQATNPMSTVLLQLKYAQFIREATHAINKTIDELNQERSIHDKTAIKKIDNSVKNCTAFANKNAMDDIQQIMQNIQNFILLETLRRLKNSSDQTLAATRANKINTQITHCNIKPSREKSFDVDAGSSHSLQPHGYNSYVLLTKSCLAINQKMKNQNLSVEKQLDGKIRFDYKNQNFYFNTRSGAFSGDNMNEETFHMMLTVYNHAYKNKKMEMTCDDSVSQNLCAAGIANYNKTAQDKIRTGSVTTRVEKIPLTQTENKNTKTEKVLKDSEPTHVSLRA